MITRRQFHRLKVGDIINIKLKPLKPNLNVVVIKKYKEETDWQLMNIISIYVNELLYNISRYDINNVVCKRYIICQNCLLKPTCQVTNHILQCYENMNNS